MNGRRVIAMVGLTAGVSVFAFGGTSVSAGEVDPVAGCGAGYELLTIDATLDKIDDRPYLAAGTWGEVVTGVNSFDLNADNHLCSKKLPTNAGQDKKSGFDGHWSTNVSENRAAGRL